MKFLESPDEPRELEGPKPVGVTRRRTFLRPGFNVTTALLTLGAGLTHFCGKPSLDGGGYPLGKDVGLEELKHAVPGGTALWAEPAGGLQGERGDRRRGRVKVLEGLVDWSTLL